MKPASRKWRRDLGLPNVGTRLSDCRHYRYDKNRAYKEGFDEFLEFARPVRVNGKTWRAHPNINMYIDATSRCNGDCGFCIAKTAFDRRDCDPNDFVRKLESAIHTTRDMNPSVQVVGGEPTLSPTLPDILNLISKHNMRNRVLGTNGSGLHRRHVGNAIREAGIQHINLSRHHYDHNKNDEIMHLHPFSTNKMFFRCFEFVNPAIVRLQCNLIGGFIDCYDEVIAFIEWARGHEIRNFAFAQLTPLPREDMYQDGIIEYVETRQVDINSIIESAERDNRFAFKKYRGGVACYYEVWEFVGDTTVLFKFSDNKWLSLADKTECVLPDLVFHTDGTLCGSWNRNLKVLV